MEEKKEVLEQERSTEQTVTASAKSGKRASGKKNGLARHVAFVLVAVLLPPGSARFCQQAVFRVYLN